MKKKLLLALLLAVQTTFAQIISKDPTFASNGKHAISNNSISNSYQMIQDSNGGIYFTYNIDVSPGITYGYVSKLTANGILDPTFGNNGTVQLPWETDMNQIKRQTDGKLLILGIVGNSSVIFKLLPNGQLDTTYGTNGISEEIPVDHDDFSNSYEFILQNEKIILHGIRRIGQNHHHAIYRLNGDGTWDNTFGNNGYVITQGNLTGRTFVLLDNQSNIISFSDNISVIEKFDSNGHPITTFGNNGVMQININGSTIGDVGTAMMDSNNKIIFSTNGNHDVFRINPNGTPDNIFNYNLYTTLGLNAGPEIFSIKEKNGYYYIAGNGGDFVYNRNYLIAKLNQNGSMDSTFGYYLEKNYDDPSDPFVPPLGTIYEMMVNNNNIIVKGSGFIVKYLPNTATLSTTESVKNNSEFSFENPVKQNLVYKSKEKINKIEIYSIDGKIVKTLKDNNTNISELSKVTYFAKITFENGKIITKKLIKN